MVNSNPSILSEISRLLTRDIKSFKAEIELYGDDTQPWQFVEGISNPGGTLALHVAGNLRHFIGATLGNSGYVRNRAQEFEVRGLSKEELCSILDQAENEITLALSNLDPAILDQPFPIAFGEKHPGTRQFLMHLATHTTYHLGQLDYHRRVTAGSKETVGAVAIPPIMPD